MRTLIEIAVIAVIIFYIINQYKIKKPKSSDDGPQLRPFKKSFKNEDEVFEYCITYLKRKPKNILANYYHCINCWFWVFPDYKPSNLSIQRYYWYDLFQEKLCGYIKSVTTKEDRDNCQMKAIYAGLRDEYVQSWIEQNY